MIPRFIKPLDKNIGLIKGIWNFNDEKASQVCF